MVRVPIAVRGPQKSPMRCLDALMLPYVHIVVVLDWRTGRPKPLL